MITRDASARFARSALADLIEPEERLSLPDWVARHRRISEDSTSPYPGAWEHARTPYLVEVMACLDPAHPARDVTAMKCHQSGFTEAGLNALGYYIDQEPRPTIYVLPSIEEAQKFNRLKLDPMIKATTKIRHKVAAESVRGQAGSTATFKRFRGGSLVVANAHSPSALQMTSAGLMILDEISDYPPDVGGRGDPVELVEKRSTVWLRRGGKRYYLSTPAAKGHCRIERKFRASDQRRWYLRCPHCDGFVRVDFKHLAWERDTAPHRAHWDCPLCGGEVGQRHQDAAIRRGDWFKTYAADEAPETNPAPPRAFAAAECERWKGRTSAGRQPGFHLWQIASLFVDWDEIVAGYLATNGEPAKERVFQQQVLGEPYEEVTTAPDHEKLHLMRGDRPRGRVPPGAVALTGFTDVQGDRLEWAVYGWGEGLTPWLIDWGIEWGSTEAPEVWAAHDSVIRRTWPDVDGRRWGADLWGVDSGYRSHTVYHYCRGRENVVATMGESGQGGKNAAVQPIVSAPKKVDYDWRGVAVPGGVMRFDLGTYPLKTWLYDSLRQALKGPDPETGAPRRGAMQFCAECDPEFFEQLTAEGLVEHVDRMGRIRRGWKKVRDRNEQLDIACGARAMAEILELDRYDDADWAALRARRGAPQLEMFGPAAALRDEAAAAKTQRRASDQAPAVSPAVERWIETDNDWVA